MHLCVGWYEVTIILFDWNVGVQWISPKIIYIRDIVMRWEQNRRCREIPISMAIAHAILQNIYADWEYYFYFNTMKISFARNIQQDK